jgi:enterochelin esterase-like enzyme
MRTPQSKAVFVLALLLAACSPAAAQPTATLRIPAKTESPTKQPAPSASVTEETTLGSIDKDLCLKAGGRIEQDTLDSEFFEDGLAFRVYTPPCYAEHPEERYPVLYLIHGQTYTDEQWDRIGVNEAADKLIASGEAAPFIIVMPHDHNSLRPTVGFFDDAFLGELLPWIDAEFRTLADREHRSVGGLSRGASWAIHFALTDPDLFGALGGHSPPVFIEEANKVADWLDAIPAGLMPRIWLDIGDRDTRNILDSALWFESLLVERGIAHEWHLIEGGEHSEEYWSSQVDGYLRWYAEEW